MPSPGSIGPIIAQAIAQRLDAVPNSRAQLVEGGLPSKILDRLTTPEGHENTLLTQAGPLKEILGIDLGLLLLAEAKRQLWGTADKLTDITSHRELVAALDKYEAAHGRRRLAHAVGMPDAFDRFRAWKEGKRQISIERFKLALLAVVANRTNAVSATPFPPSRYQRRKKQGQLSTNARPGTDGTRKLVGYALSTIGTQITVLEEITDPAMVNQGDRLQVLRSICRLLVVFGINKDELRSLQHPKLLNIGDNGELMDVLTNLTTSSEKRK